MIKAVLFDLDGTLLPMEQDIFTKTYFGLLSQRMKDYGYEPEELIKSVWSGTKAMIKNDGSKTNRQAFWDEFARIYGEKARDDEGNFEEFYLTDFEKVKSVCRPNPLAVEAVAQIKNLGCRTVLATNPIFPDSAAKARMRWAGFEPQQFEYYTTYENCRFSKPNPKFYAELLEKLEQSAEECFMVGNDVDDDMIAQSIGMKVFLLTDCVINKENKDISVYPGGDFAELIEYVKGQLA